MSDLVIQEDVLAFWFGELDEDGLAGPNTSKRWFIKDEAFDAEICTRFQGLYESLAASEHDDWPHTPRGALAAIIVLDQFSRNMFRGTSKMYAADERAVVFAEQVLDRDFDRVLSGDLRVFLYMPLMHAEDLARQKQCCQLFERYLTEARAANNVKLSARLESNLKFALWHRDIVERFGRFPHRNAILGRESTAEEAVFLQQPNSSF